MLRAHLFIAEHATGHKDGTFSILKGGLNQFILADEGNRLLRFTIVARVSAEAEDAGPHAWMLALQAGSDGESRRLQGDSFTFAPSGVAHLNVIAENFVRVPALGTYFIVLTVDEKELCRARFDVIPTPSAPKEGP